MPKLRAGLLVWGGLGVLMGGVPAFAQEPAQLVVTAPSAPARSCPDASCRVVTELSKDATVSVVKVQDGWYQVMLTLPGARATTGWVQAKQVGPTTRATRAAAATPRAVPPARGGEEEVERDCLTCVATRQPTRAEWETALSATAAQKAAPDGPRESAAGAQPQSSLERMRATLEQDYGHELKRLSEQADLLTEDLQSYLTTCYDRLTPIEVEGAAPRTAVEGPSVRTVRPTPRGALHALLADGSSSQWRDSWTENIRQANASTSLCREMWQDIEARAGAIRSGMRDLELDARHAGIYPGVVREAFQTHGLAEPPR